VNAAEADPAADVTVDDVGWGERCQVCRYSIRFRLRLDAGVGVAQDAAGCDCGAAALRRTDCDQEKNERGGTGEEGVADERGPNDLEEGR
jgi:hypothetical protein